MPEAMLWFTLLLGFCWCGRTPLSSSSEPEKSRLRVPPLCDSLSGASIFDTTRGSRRPEKKLLLLCCFSLSEGLTSDTIQYNGTEVLSGLGKNMTIAESWLTFSPTGPNFINSKPNSTYPLSLSLFMDLCVILPRPLDMRQCHTLSWLLLPVSQLTHSLLCPSPLL